MSDEDGLPRLREVIARHGLDARKSLGQNFLLDLNLTRRIARSAGEFQGLTVYEVGPGPGGLTRALLMEGAERVVAIERDERALPALEEIATAYPEKLEVISGDALSQDWAAMLAEPSCIVANLPYNIATPLLTKWLSLEPWPLSIRSWTLMFQREVADRISAPPASRAFGRLGVLSQWRCHVDKLFDVDRRAFTPPPKVTSSIVQLVPKPTPEPHCNVRTLERVTAAAFGQRRKMLRSSLKSLTSDSIALLRHANIAPERRAEELEVEDFCRLAALLDDGHP